MLSGSWKTQLWLAIRAETKQSANESADWEPQL